jgi:iron complex outermembrane recepter protein
MMTGLKFLKAALIGGAAAVLTTGASARQFDIPGGDLASALSEYSSVTGVQLIYAEAAISGIRTRGVKGDLSADAALSRILSGTDFVPYRHSANVIGIARQESAPGKAHGEMIADATATHAASSVETVVVTSSKIKGDIQTVPIAITALSQEQLTSRQIAGGPDLVKEVPNLTFSKTNFTGYNIEIRGIGTQAISVTTDPAVAVAFNDTPFIRNHFFEQEFFDVSQVEVLRGPQGTLYGRNATAGVVNVVSAKPTDEFEAMLSADWGNYTNRRYEGMVNLPITGDKLMLRIAGEWTKRDGYSFNDITNKPIDGRDLWSSRMTLRWRPVERLTADVVWEHFSENDDRLRTAKQLCEKDPGPGEVLGVPVGGPFLNQGCLPVSMYSADAFQVPNGFALPYYGGLVGAGFGLAILNPLLADSNVDPYASVTQSRNLRAIDSTLNPQYKAKNDTVELNASYALSPSLSLTSDTGYNRDFLFSTEDYNRFNTTPGIFAYSPDQFGNLIEPLDPHLGVCGQAYGECAVTGVPCDPAQATSLECTRYGAFVDPQLGPATRLVAEDLSDEHAWQLSQEIRLASEFNGPLNFSFGGNYMHYVTEENYYVFINTLTMFSANDAYGVTNPWIPGVSDNTLCRGFVTGHQYTDINNPGSPEGCLGYIDPNPIGQLNNEGHNYFLSQNPYTLDSYAVFGEAYYNLTKDLKLTGGLRWTDDQKHFVEIPSELLTRGYGYPSTGSVNQQWKEWTGRFVMDWAPTLDFTDQSMFYASYAHGYKAGGANPPGAVLLIYGGSQNPTEIAHPVHPLTFKPEFNDAFELGTKNTALDGNLIIDADAFYYDYKGYQISQIVDRTSVNLNFDATVKGAEVQLTWSPLANLKFSFAGGYEDTRINDGQSAIDLIDRTAGNPNWMVVKPFVTQASNCILPKYVIAYQLDGDYGPNGYALSGDCGNAYISHVDPVTGQPYTSDLTGATTLHGDPVNPVYQGFDPLAGTSGDPYTGQNTYEGVDYGPVPNNGEGFAKPLGGKQLPNAPHYTTSLTADYTMPVSANWAATLHGDFYWQSQSWARVFNAVNDKIHGYSNVNLALILTDASGWQVMGYVKNIFDTTAITGTFLNSDDTGLPTNVFLTDPRLFGVRVTKHFDGGSGSDFDIFSSAGGTKPEVWLTLGGNFAQFADNWEHYNPSFTSLIPDSLPSPLGVERSPSSGFDWDADLSFQPDKSDWVLKAGIRYGRSAENRKMHKSLPPSQYTKYITGPFCTRFHFCTRTITATVNKLVDAHASASEQHTMLDFTLGKDFGLGIFGGAGQSTISGGVRAVQFDTRASAELNSNPNWIPKFTPPYLLTIVHDVLDGTTDEHRNFRGIGPEVTWDADAPVFGSPENGEVMVDWGVNAALLFGRQRANIRQRTSDLHCSLGFPSHGCASSYSPQNVSRSRRLAVPNLGGYAGLSVKYSNAKISFGYRADEFFGAMDGGQGAAKKYDRGFYGPYLNLSLGFGG